MAKNSSNGAHPGFEQKLWQTADKLRSNMNAVEYKSVVLGLRLSNMVDLKSKFKGHSFLKELLFAFIFSIVINLCIILIGPTPFIQLTFTSDFTPIYYTALMSFLTIYAALIVISTNLSQEFPLNISLKYIVYSRFSLSYLLTLLLNFLTIAYGNFEQRILMRSIMILFLFTIIFILLFMKKFDLKVHLKSFFDDMMNKYSGDFILPKISNNYNILEAEGFIQFTSKDFLPETEKVDFRNIEAKSLADTNLSTAPPPKQKLSTQMLRIFIGKGKLQVKNWTFLNKINHPIRFRIYKYEFGDNSLSFQILCEYHSIENKKDIDKELKNIMQKNIQYKELPKEEFKEVFDKLCKNGTEEKLIVMIKNHIARQNNLLERRFLYYSFEEYFKKTALNKNAIDTDEILRIEITNLYEQKELFFKSPAIVSKLQDKLTILLVNGFRKINYFSSRLNTSGLYIKEFLDIRYLDDFKKSIDKNWVQEYDYLITNTINNCFLLCKSIIELDLKERELKRRYLFEQLGNLNTTLGHYDYFTETDLLDNYYGLKFKSQRTPLENQQLELADEKLDIIKKQKEYLKEKQLELFYLILYNIDRGELTKDFFDVALKIFNLENFDKQYYKYERFDKLDWLNYDRFTGGAQVIAPFHFNKYRLVISFYNYLNTGNIDIKKFEKENFTDYISSFEKELDNIKEEFISKYFDDINKKFAQFKAQALKEIKEKKESLERDKRNYIIRTSLKEKYVNEFIKECKEAWEANQKNLSKFMLLKQVEGGNKIENFFGQYTLFNKEWFLDSFDKNIALSRNSGKMLGHEQVNSKIKQVLNLINKLFDEQKDEDIVVKDIYSDLAKEIQSNKEYYLFYSSEFDIHKIPNLDWNRQGMETAILSINNSKIHLCYSFNPEILLFEKDSFILKQYEQGYENIDGPLVVQIEILDKEDEIKQILKSDKNFKSEEDVKQMVKIRIAEKFEVERNENAKLIRIKS